MSDGLVIIIQILYTEILVQLHTHTHSANTYRHPQIHLVMYRHPQIHLVMYRDPQIHLVMYRHPQIHLVMYRDPQIHLVMYRHPQIHLVMYRDPHYHKPQNLTGNEQEEGHQQLCKSCYPF